MSPQRSAPHTDRREADEVARVHPEKPWRSDRPPETVDELIRALNRWPRTARVTVYDPDLGAHRPPILHPIRDKPNRPVSEIEIS